MKRGGSAFVAGIIFALGLGLSGMTNPSKITAFLDITGVWDGSLALVMLGAITVHLPVALWAKRARPTMPAEGNASRIDAPLVIGSALFGLGWGIAGFCPGPALADLVAPSPSIVTFAAAMLAGMAGWNLFAALREKQSEGPRLRTRAARGEVATRI